MLHGNYDIRLSLFSIAIAILTAYTTLDLAGRVAEAKSQERSRWVAGGAITMGTGIWAMHFIAMLAFSLPVPIYYDWLIVVVSVIPAILASGLALCLISLPEIKLFQLLSGSVLMGAGISAMHYIGMAAVRLSAKVSYDLNIVVLSIAIAILISLIALWVGFKLRADTTFKGKLLKLGSAIILGAAIPSMHYTGMIATHFSNPQIVNTTTVDTTRPLWMAGIVGLVTVFLLGWTLLISFFNKKLSVQIVKTVVLKENQELLQQALQKQADLANLAQTRSEELEAAMLALQTTQLQFIQAEKMSSLGQMVAGVAHEINNPVNFIYGNLFHVEAYMQELLELVNAYQQHYPDPVPEILLLTKSIDLQFLQEDLLKTLESIQAGATRIKHIVESLRNFSRLDEAELKTVDIHEGLNSTLLILKNRLTNIEGNRPEVTVIKKYAQLPLVNCYPGQLNQAFFNILANAIDALDEKYNNNTKLNAIFKPIIRITTNIHQEKWVSIQIFDNGFGINEEVQRKIYDPFFTTKPVGKGVGLGLSISYQIIIEKHGGKLSCLSAYGQGTTFKIEIPIDNAIAASQ
ncbi:MHYT domain-containing protein [Nostoc sp. MS1]|uniref:MHYT domain-containing protein n=1 Tax=Nostoc sp. MS1 TaxID=2764711 RepID=UPI001CC33D5E|nr:MHYT domain-containing protein [Nostoc sp. MS1]BCL35441.1 sensor histidine kinase [Nostoc sp. MS1]